MDPPKSDLVNKTKKQKHWYQTGLGGAQNLWPNRQFAEGRYGPGKGFPFLGPGEPLKMFCEENWWKPCL